MNLNPKPRQSNYRYSGPKVKGPSLRYTLILDGAVMKYSDGREVCQPNLKGMREYKRRIQTMCERQDDTCCICKDLEDEAGKEMNGAAHYECNGEKGSKRSAGVVGSE